MVRLPIPKHETRLTINNAGPIVYINVAGQDMVILNTHKAAADLLDRRAPIYSNRPRWIGTRPLTESITPR
jgi:hypothetical protein